MMTEVLIVLFFKKKKEKRTRAKVVHGSPQSCCGDSQEDTFHDFQYIALISLLQPFGTLFALDHLWAVIRRKNIFKNMSVIFRVFTNLLRTNTNKKCKNVYMTRTVTR